MLLMHSVVTVSIICTTIKSTSVVMARKTTKTFYLRWTLFCNESILLFTVFLYSGFRRPDQEPLLEIPKKQCFEREIRLDAAKIYVLKISNRNVAGLNNKFSENMRTLQHTENITHSKRLIVDGQCWLAC